MAATTEDLNAIFRALREAEATADRDVAREHLNLVQGKAKALGIESSHLYGLLTRMHLAFDEYEEAFEAASRAVMLDPFNPALTEAFRSTADALRVRLRAVATLPDDESAPRLYAMLAAAGETDADCHLSLSKFHVLRGELDAAERLLKATTRLAPGFVKAWEALADLAVRRGDAASAEQCRARAGSLGLQTTGLLTGDEVLEG